MSQCGLWCSPQSSLHPCISLPLLPSSSGHDSLTRGRRLSPPKLRPPVTPTLSINGTGAKAPSLSLSPLSPFMSSLFPASPSLSVLFEFSMFLFLLPSLSVQFKKLAVLVLISKIVSMKFVELFVRTL
ncbi:hypothetical protein E2C01_057541 [Portunus trituberculatus]|uniref:Uncharacterized protein n=1 Tax=Portunus trituberculatus TaxID=210409 RepID=A0A5B7H0A4_PORTR|nr:hypothetical protein [Portunus trituberculatus]